MSATVKAVSPNLEEGKLNGVSNGVVETVHMNGTKNGFSHGDSKDACNGTSSGFSYGCVSSALCSSLSNGIHNGLSPFSIHKEISSVPLSEPRSRAENGESNPPKILGVNGSIAVSGS